MGLHLFEGGVNVRHDSQYRKHFLRPTAEQAIPMSLDKATVRNIANLARIDIRDEELDHLAGELSNIMTFVEQLAEVNTDGVEPMTSVAAMTLPMRKDVINDGGQPDAVLLNAPEAEDGFFTVPKVVE
jgi:aspartyl-tRNA(Asn)/glutamyl-tRNA(Gln) amidotransferase subunit C